MDMALSKLKESLGKGKGRANMEEAHECCSFSGECHPINEGETCSDGVIRSVSKMHYIMQIITLGSVIKYKTRVF